MTTITYGYDNDLKEDVFRITKESPALQVDIIIRNPPQYAPTATFQTVIKIYEMLEDES